MLSQDSYLKQFLDFYKEEFPRSGWPANVYTGELRYVVEDFEAVDKIVMGLERERDEREILTEANFWWTHFKNYLITGKNLTDWREAFEVEEEEDGEESEAPFS